VTLKRIRMELARSRAFPSGSTKHGYEFVLPLGGDAKLDKATYDKAPQISTVHRFWGGDDDETGQLVHRRGRWLFSFRGENEDDEPIHRFEGHVFKEGEYISVREPDGEMHTFKIVLVRDAPGLATRPS
jgi:hypothetical protein